MKTTHSKKLSFVALLLTLILLAVCSAMATPTLIVGSLVAVNNTTSNSVYTTALNYSPQLQQWSVTHTALPNTNAFYLTFRVSLDQTNAVAVGTWYPSNTNACTEIVPANQFNITNYVQISCTTTSSVSYSASYGQ